MATSRLPKFTDRINKLRNDYDSNTNFADALGLTRQAVGSYLNGKRIPDAQILTQIAEETGVSIDWLLGLSEAKTIDPIIQSACEFTNLPEESLEIIKKVAEDPIYKEVLRIFFFFLDNELMGNGRHFLQSLADLYSNAYSCAYFTNDSPPSEGEREKSVLNEIKKLQAELPEQRLFHLIDATKYADVLKSKAANEFQEFLNYLNQAASIRWDKMTNDVLSSDEEKSIDEIVFLDEDEPTEEPPWEY